MTDVKRRPSLEGVAAAAEAAPKARGLPPVHLWNPENVGQIDIVVQRDGAWRHEGGIISREALVRLFSTVLRKDPDGYWLVTPIEKLKISVEDAPFLAVAVRQEGEDLVFTTNVGDETRAGPENPIRVETDPATGEPRPYVHVRRGLEARINRPVFYELAELAEDRDGRLGVRSGGAWFDIGASEAAEA
ncbi:MAG: DUF1285 domain-containing protein [Phenylobacterium sp.]